MNSPQLQKIKRKAKIKKEAKRAAVNSAKFIANYVQNFDPKEAKENLVKASGNFDGHIRHNAHNYEPLTGAYLRREWRGPVDTLVDYKFWLMNWAQYGLIYSKGPAQINEAAMKYRWIWSLFQATSTFDHGKEGLRGTALKVANMNFNKLHLLVGGGILAHTTAQKDKTVYLEMTQFSTLCKGFDDIGYIAPGGFSAYLASTLDGLGAIPYLDAAETYGVTPDVCPLPEMGAGLAVLDDLIKEAICGIGTNMPCDSGILSTLIMDKRLKIPMYQLFTPVRYKDEGAIDYMVKDLKGAIKFLEEHIGQTFSFEKLIPFLEALNEQNLLSVDKLEINRSDYPQYISSWAWMYRMMTIGSPSPLFTPNDKKTIALMQKAVKNQEKIHPQQRLRSIVWGAPCNYYSYLQTWLLNCWGVVNVYSMLGDIGALQAYPIETEDEMLNCLAENIVRNSMRKQTNGGYDNILDELWDLCDEYRIDIVFLQDHIGCKGMDGLITTFEEQAEERGIKLCTIPQDLMDPRTVSRMEMREKINNFMYNVMNVEPLVPELVNFDDTHGH